MSGDTVHSPQPEASLLPQMAGQQDVTHTPPLLATPTSRYALPMPTFPSGPLSTDGAGHFVDQFDRQVLLTGVNLDAGAKAPVMPLLTLRAGGTRDPECPGIFYAGDEVLFVGRPFPLDLAPVHLRRLKRLGFNTVRFIITWEAIEHAGPGVYDELYIDYTISVLRLIAEEGGLYVFIDPHQDVWLRFTGGSGAPMWTLYAAGLNPRNLVKTGAAVLHCEAEDPAAYTKMVWTTNYFKLAAATMFTLFFGGRLFAPRCEINGINIQDYLQQHFILAISHFWKRVVAACPELVGHPILGVESLNEPNSGWVGWTDITTHPKSQPLRLDATPTALQAMRLGMGMPCEVDDYEISVTGPRKRGTITIDPEGTRAWLTPAEALDRDEHYGFTRGLKWDIGTCVWALHGVMDAVTGECLDPTYFGRHPNTGETVDEEWFINNLFVDFYRDFRSAIRQTTPDAFIFCQPPVLKVPPRLVGGPLVDLKTVYTPHYYDGMLLLFKTWNRKYNVDTFGIMRGRYANPVLGMVLGETNIRKCIRRQFSDMCKELLDYMGPQVPVLMLETGMPYDMDDKEAYGTGKYNLQTAALDALGFALEGNAMNVTWWTYCAENTHTWGDAWNNEDFSCWSRSDQLDGDYVTLEQRMALCNANGSRDSALGAVAPGAPDPFNPDSLSVGTLGGDGLPGDLLTALAFSGGLVPPPPVHDAASVSSHQTTVGNQSTVGGQSTIGGQSVYRPGTRGSLVLQSVLGTTTSSRNFYALRDGLRGHHALVRPRPVAASGRVEFSQFLLGSGEYTLRLRLCVDVLEHHLLHLPHRVEEFLHRHELHKRVEPTVVYLPLLHFDMLLCRVDVSSGHVEYHPEQECVLWFHGSGHQEMVVRALGSSSEAICAPGQCSVV